jgi:hypothetical protein
MEVSENPKKIFCLLSAEFDDTTTSRFLLIELEGEMYKEINGKKTYTCTTGL